MTPRRAQYTKIRWDFDKIFSRSPPSDAAAAAAGDDADAAAAAANGDVTDAARANGDAANAGGDAVALQGLGGGPAAVMLDVGFGLGESLLGMAAARPDDYFLGIEASDT